MIVASTRLATNEANAPANRVVARTMLSESASTPPNRSSTRQEGNADAIERAAVMLSFIANLLDQEDQQHRADEAVEDDRFCQGEAQPHDRRQLFLRFRLTRGRLQHRRENQAHADRGPERGQPDR